jgi:hypothetical protein
MLLHPNRPSKNGFRKRVGCQCGIRIADFKWFTRHLTPALSPNFVGGEGGISAAPLKIRATKKAASPTFAGKAAGLWDGKFYAAVACAFACGAGGGVGLAWLALVQPCFCFQSCLRMDFNSWRRALFASG